MKAVKNGRIVKMILIAGLLAACLLALHDMQAAEGVGLFFALKLGYTPGQRGVPDMLVDVQGIAALALLVYLPCRCLKHISVDAYLRLLIAYLAAVPTLSLAGVIHLFDRGDGTPAWDMDLLQIWLPVFLLLYGIAEVNHCFVWERWHRLSVFIFCAALLLICLLPGMGNLLSYVAGYAGLWFAFDLWEKLYERMPRLQKGFFFIFAALLLRGIYRIVVLMSQY